MTNKKLSFAVENISLLDDENLDHSQFSLLRADIFATGRSLHDTFVTEENLRKNAKTILQKPFVFFEDRRTDDAGGHNDQEVAVGFVPHNSSIDFRTLDDGRTMLTCEVLVWKRYSKDLLRYFQRDGGRKGVSVELEIIDSKQDKNGLLEILNYCFNAITCLGQFITPAIPNAEAVLQFSKDFEEAKKKYEFSSRYDEVDMTIPSEVKQNAQKALDSYNQNGGKISNVALANARFLSKNDKMTPERMKQLHKTVHKNMDDMTTLCWGGEESKLWSESIVKLMDEIDMEQSMFYEKGGDLVPYQSLKDANPAIKGIDPPVTLTQANAIAKQADAVGTSDKVNGWAVAIASFKKTHVVRDGKWIAKESMSEEFAKEDLGKGSALKVNKSKESMSDKPWGNVDKIALRNKILNASNYRSLVNDVYMLVESGWEDHPSSSLKYPVMELSGDTLVYNRYGLSAALQRAEGQNESGVVSKVHGIYKKMGLDKPDSNKKFAQGMYNLTSAQCMEILNNALPDTLNQVGYKRYWVETYDDICVYVHDSQDESVYCASYELNPETCTATIDMENAHPAIHGNQLKEVQKKKKLRLIKRKRKKICQQKKK